MTKTRINQIFLSKSVTRQWGDLMLGNRLFIDLANSVYDGGGRLSDPLERWEDGLTFLLLASALDREEALRLLNQGSSRGNIAVLEALRSLRQTMRGMCEAVVQGSELSSTIIEAINETLPFLDGGERLAKAKAGFTFRHELLDGSPQRVMGLIGRSAAEFLVNDQRQRLKRCTNEDCPLFFYDTSKNGRRRWCRMDVCGNRAKVSTHYHRHKA